MLEIRAVDTGDETRLRQWYDVWRAGQSHRRADLIPSWEAAGRPVPLEEHYAAMGKQRGVPLGRVGEAEEVGDLIAYLCSAPAAYLTGVAINIDGGTSGAV